jgi:hypothetical protein
MEIGFIMPLAEQLVEGQWVVAAGCALIPEKVNGRIEALLELK